MDWRSVYTFPPMDPMLASVYGGVLLGASMGSLMLVNTTTGGTELGARLLKFPLPHLSIGKLCLCIDVIVVSGYAAVFHSILNAMYGIIALYIASIVMDYIIYGSRTAQVAYIVSDRYEQITEKLLSMDRGLTLLNGEGAYSKQQRKVHAVRYEAQPDRAGEAGGEGDRPGRLCDRVQGKRGAGRGLRTNTPRTIFKRRCGRRGGGHEKRAMDRFAAGGRFSAFRLRFCAGAQL